MASKIVDLNSNSYNISYEIVNPNNEKTIIFLHGWGANKKIMKKAFSIFFKEYKHIYIDMPGFGDSSIANPLKTKDYAIIIEEFMKQSRLTPEIILGHSFGGKVATLLNPKKLVLLSSAGIIVQKPFYIQLKIKIFKILKLIGLGKFYKFFATKDVDGMNKVMYETLKNVVDEDFTNYFKSLTSKTFIFWGKADKATPLKSGNKINSLIKNSQFFSLEGDHFFFLFHSKFISEIVCNDIKEKNLEKDNFTGVLSEV